MATIKGTSAKELARLFKDNMWKLHRLLESVVSDRGPQFAVRLTKELNRILRIEMKLSMVFHPQTNRQMEWMNQELEQYLRFFVKHRQKDWSEQLASAEFTANNKVHIVTKISPFIANYGRELRMGDDIKRRKKVKKAMEFMKRMKQIQEEVGAVLKKAQENMKRQANKRRRESKNQKKRDRVLLSTKDLVFKERLARKLVD